MNNTIQLLLTCVLPFIKELVESKVVPTIKRKAYERLDDFVNDRIEDAATLVDKIYNEKNEIKKQAHLDGLRLGVATLRAIGEKLLKACEEFEKVLA